MLGLGAVAVGVAEVTSLLTNPPPPGLFAVVFAVRYPDRQVEQLPDDYALTASIAELVTQTNRIYSAIQGSISKRNPQFRFSRIDGVNQTFGAWQVPMSQKAVAVLAGLGWIGKSSLLVTPADGPRVRLATLFTDAPIKVDQAFSENRCHECRICEIACPADAITGETIRVRGWEGFRIERERCETFVARNQNSLGRKEFCGICLKECPVGTGKKER